MYPPVEPVFPSRRVWHTPRNDILKEGKMLCRGRDEAARLPETPCPRSNFFFEATVLAVSALRSGFSFRLIGV